MHRKRGRSLKGHPARKPARIAKGVHHSIVAAIIPQYGLLAYRIYQSQRGGAGPGVATERFTDFVKYLCEDKLVDKLIDWPCWFIMDNCSAHNEEKIREVIKPHGHQLLFVPPYSPQFNPIENCFGIWKTDAHQRRMGTEDELRDAIDAGAKRITPAVTLKAWQKVKETWIPQAFARSNF